MTKSSQKWMTHLLRISFILTSSNDINLSLTENACYLLLSFFIISSDIYRPDGKKKSNIGFTLIFTHGFTAYKVLFSKDF